MKLDLKGFRQAIPPHQALGLKPGTGTGTGEWNQRRNLSKQRSYQTKQLAKSRRQELRQLERQGIIGIVRFSNSHVRLCGYVDYWPSTGRTYNRITRKRIKIRVSLAEVLPQVPKPEVEPRLISHRHEYRQHLDSAYWRALKEKVVVARGYRCEECGSQRATLHLHHLHYCTFGQETEADVQLLCKACHNQLHCTAAGRRRMKELRTRLKCRRCRLVHWYRSFGRLYRIRSNSTGWKREAADSLLRRNGRN